MLRTTPFTDKRTTDTRRSHTSDLITRIVEAEERSLDRGDGDTADVLSAAIAYIVNEEWHQATYWATAEQVMGHYVDRLERMYAALGRAER